MLSYLRNTLKSACLIIILSFLSACGYERSGSNEVKSDENRKVIAQPVIDSNGWPLHGRTYAGERFSLLDSISDSNVGQLGLAWHFDLPRDGGQEATPLVFNGVIYFTGSWSVVYALNAKTGELIWSYDPKVDRSTLIKACCGPNNRGVAYWDGKIYVGAFDGRLIALDSQTGEVIWSTQTVDDPENSNYTITGAPLVANGKVFIGNGGADIGARGYVGAYDAEDGSFVWRFYTVPGNPADGFENQAMEMAAKTWFGEWWKLGGGGTAYDALAYDPELNLFYIGVGNAGPYNPVHRTDGKGDNLFVASIVAVNADTGEYVWHYQTTPGDSWDYTATQNMIFADLEIEGQKRKVIMQAPKNGFFYVLDRATGEFISAEAYDTVTWADGIDENGRPRVSEKAKYWLLDDPKPVFPGALGAHNWQPMSYSPLTGYVYIPVLHLPTHFVHKETFEPIANGHNMGIDYSVLEFPADPAIIKQIKSMLYGKLVAWDPVAQKEVWSVKQAYPMNGGVLTTAGNLVFQGTSDGEFIAYNAASGEPAWRFDAQTFVVAAPITYEIDGEQYVAVLAGRGGTMGINGGATVAVDLVQRSRLLVFKLDGGAQLPEPNEPRIPLPDWSALEVDQDKADKGSYLYNQYCLFCHGFGVVGSSIIPDLRYSGFMENQKAFDSVVLDGLLSSRGMVGFAEDLNQEQTEQLRHYIISRNKLSRKFGDTSRIGR